MTTRDTTTTDQNSDLIAIRVDYETAGGDETAFTRYVTDTAPDTIAETIALCPQGALVEDIQIGAGGDGR